LLIFLAGLLAGLAVVRGFCRQGVLAPVRVAGGSMAPLLDGGHFAVTCEDCEFSFACDATSVPETGEAVCPNCGFPGNPLSPAQLRPGTRVVIDRFPYVPRGPRRWELVAFHDPLAPAEKAVKRVIGLPGETVLIHEGDVFIDGRVARKPLDVQRAMAVLVHDDAFRPTRTHNLPPRWDSPAPSSGWSPRENGYQFSPLAELPSNEIDWLMFHGWRCFASPLARSAESPVLDHYGYNQNTSRELHAVTDLTLSCRVRWSAASKLWLRVTSPRDAFEVELDRWRQSATLRRDDVLIGTYACPLPGACDLEFGVCDRQVYLTVDRRVALRVEFEPAARAAQPTAHPLAIGARQDALRVENLRVYRDVYYLEPHRRSLNWTARTELARREILVLGDNVPISRDSRQWPTPGLARKSLIGRVLMPF